MPHLRVAENHRKRIIKKNAFVMCQGVVVNKKKLHDGESFANRWSHPKTGRRLFAGGIVVLEEVREGARVVVLRGGVECSAI